jgi:hypothetical protein
MNQSRAQAARALGALREEDEIAAVLEDEARVLERLVRLDHVDVARSAAA